MKYPLKIKLGSITNLSDARYAAAVGIDFIGFNFTPNTPGYIAPIKAKEIIEWTSGSMIVAEFGNQSVNEIIEIAELLNVDIIEVNNTLLPAELLEIGKPIIKKIDIGKFSHQQVMTELTTYQQAADAFLIYTTSSGVTFDESALQAWCQSSQIIWGLDVNETNVHYIIDTIKPYGIQLLGGEEERPGVKDFDALADLLESIGTEEY